MRTWKDNPRWKTAHRLFKAYEEQPEVEDFFQHIYNQVMHKFELDDVVCASKLAYKVFFELYVMPYERRKRIDNGEIL